MSIIRWKPLGELEELIKDFSPHPFRMHASDLAIDVSENDKNIFIQMHIPGIEPEKVVVEIEDNHLHVSGERTNQYTTEDRAYYHREIKCGMFERVISLPCAVDEKNIKAEYKQGVLYLTLPKIERSHRTKITVNTK